MLDWLASLATLTLSAALHALLLVLLFTNFPALGDESPKKIDEPRLVVVATILPEKKIETTEPLLKPIPTKNKTPEPKKQKTPTPTKTRMPSDALRALPPSPSAPPPSMREAKDSSPGAESFSPPPGGGTARVAGRGEGTITSLASVRIVERVKPQYPQIARKRNEEGTVVLLARVQNGRVASLSVEKSSGVKTLDASASNAVSRWKFSPDTNATVRVPVSFSLKE